MKRLFTLLTLISSFNLYAQVNGDFRSKQSGDWSSTATWEVFDAGNLVWNPATTVPDSNNSVWLQDGDSVALSANAKCKDFHLNAQIDAADSARITTGSFTLRIFGKIRTYSGAKGVIPGANSTGLNNSPRFINTNGGGKLQFAGAGRDLTKSGEWGVPALCNGWNLDFALNPGDTGKLNTNIRAGNITISSGVIVIIPGAGTIRPDGGAVGTGNLTIADGGQLVVSITAVARTASERFGTFTIEPGGMLVLPSSNATAAQIAATNVDMKGTVATYCGYLISNGSFTGAAATNSYGVLILYANTALNQSITVNEALVLTADNQVNLNSNTLTYGPTAVVEYAGTAAQSSSNIELPASNGPSGIVVNNAAGLNLHAGRTLASLVVLQGTITFSGNLVLNALLELTADNQIILNGNTLSFGPAVLVRYSGFNQQNTSDIDFPQNNGPISMEVANPAGVVLHASRTISGLLVLSAGNLTTTATKLLTLSPAADILGGHIASFVNGPLQRTIASTSSSILDFPIGNLSSQAFRPVTLTITQDAATATTYTAELIPSAPTSRTLPGTLAYVSNTRYWQLSKGTGANITNGSIEIFYGIGDSAPVAADVRIAKSNGSNWDDLGGTGSSNVFGSITSATNFTALGDFAIAGVTAPVTGYPYPLLPIDSIQFVNAQKLATGVTLPDYQNPTPKNPTYGDTVQVEGIVMCNPRYYGLSSNRKAIFIQNQNGGPWSGVEIMCDPATVPGFPGGLAAYRTDAQFYQNSTKGLKVRYVGILKNFNGSGPATTGETQLNILPYPAEIIDLNPVTVNPTPLSISTLMKSDGAGGQTIQYLTGEQYEGVYVELTNVTVVDRAPRTGNRWNWSLQDANGNKIAIMDFSAYFRNDNLEDTAAIPTLPGTPFFNPPPLGAKLPFVRGIIIESRSASGNQEYMIAPLVPADVAPPAAQPPVVVSRSRNPVVPSSTNAVTVNARISDDTTVASATLNYAVGMSSTTFTSTPMTLSSGNAQDGNWTGTIPAQANGSFVKYFISAWDDQGRKVSSPDTLATGSAYMVIDGGITTIDQIQNTPYTNGNSIWNNDTIKNASIRGIVTATAQTNDLGLVTIQSGTAPYSGIFVQQGVGDGIDQWKRGDSVVINSCVVRENFNVTTLYNAGNANHTVVASNKTLPDFVKTLNSDSIHAKVYNQSEAYEGMLLQFDSVYVINKNADAPSNFGEFAIGKDSSKTIGLRVDDQSNDIPANFGVDSLTLKGKLNYIKGVLYFSFSNWKLLPRNRNDIAGFKIDNTSSRNLSGSAIEFSLYPNPAQHELNLRIVNSLFRQSREDYQFRMMDMTGKELQVLTIPSNGNITTYTIDISSLPAGMYFCQLSNGSASGTLKLLVTGK